DQCRASVAAVPRGFRSSRTAPSAARRARRGSGCARRGPAAGIGGLCPDESSSGDRHVRGSGTRGLRAHRALHDDDEITGTMRIERHIFGSIDGYRTLAHSPGLSVADCQLLEGFAFGTPYDPAIRATFSKQPAYWARPIGAHRRAITQVRPGDPDDAGRPTLLFLTAVVPTEEWIDALQGDSSPLMHEMTLWKWQRGAAVHPLDLPMGGPSALRVSGDRLQV